MISFIKKKILGVDRNVLGGRLFLTRKLCLGKSFRQIIRMNSNPIFIGGCGRSGTTLLLSLVSVNPHIYAIPEETRAFSMGGYPPENKIDRSLDPYIDFIYSKFMRDYTIKYKFERWCEKTPMNIHFIDKIFEYFGSGTQFINIVRDGRDVITSRHPSNPNSYYVSPNRWVRDVKAGLNFETHPRVLTVRYEDLTADYMSTMKTVFDFLEVEFPDRMKEYPESSQFAESKAWFAKARPISTASQGRWKDDEHKGVVETLMSMPEAVKLLSHYSYI